MSTANYCSADPPSSLIHINCFENHFLTQIVQKAIGKGRNIEMKTDFSDLVTESDKEVEKLLIGKLQDEFPNHRFVVYYPALLAY